MIDFDGFGWRFSGSSSWAVEHIHLHIGRGEFVAIAGASGSGKTTLAMATCGLLIGRHEGEAQGRIRVGDQDVASTPLHQVSQTIGLVQQNPEAHFATLVVSDEIAFGMENRCRPRDEIRRRSAEAMELLAITHLHDRRLATLSGGEKQRVAVASIVAARPQAIVLDEPTASLDPQASCELFRHLHELCRETGLTVVIIEHKLAHVLPLKPRLICLEQGRVVADVVADTVDDPTTVLPAGPGPIRVDPYATPSAPPLGESLITMTGVTVELGGRTILNDVSVEVRAGEVVAILGPNGGGKSTLLGSLMGLVRPARGVIQVCGVEVSPKVVSRLSRHVGFVFQNADHQLVADTVWNEAVFAARNLNPLDLDRAHEGSEMLDEAGLGGRRGDHPYRLSWGQKRRLNLISAVLHRPRLLLLDEPFAGQDWENVGFLLDAIRTTLGSGAVIDSPAQAREDGAAGAAQTTQEKGACLMVTHDPRIVARSCTRVLFVEGGGITADAPVAEAFEKLRKRGHVAYTPEGSDQLSAISPQRRDGSQDCPADR